MCFVFFSRGGVRITHVSSYLYTLVSFYFFKTNVIPLVLCFPFLINTFPQALVVGKEMVDLLQAKVVVSGAKVLSFDLMEIAYAPEIASGMLRRQQAGALIAARKVIVSENC